MSTTSDLAPWLVIACLAGVLLVGWGIRIGRTDVCRAIGCTVRVEYAPPYCVCDTGADGPEGAR